MDKQQIHIRLTQIFHDIFDNDTLEISETTTAADVEEWDSLNHVNLIVAVEKAFKIKFSTREVKGMQNVGEFIQSILEKTSK